ncbi:hypothetical protein [Streptomyces sp. TLI_171]|uniref:hypothetical protein n=1 Tax=Streptomyces sp. TLI_171 TaxID=1938859 RepID=UPI000C18BFA4|nr:hypothetical protein [Streptomyces sp. TLI_171]RKE22053.1 hypothetical protein BX266_5464 [Streptomyces sp. TLI_171]
MVLVRAGRAWLAHPHGGYDQRAWVFAAGLATDAEHTLVVVDLPGGAGEAALRELARVLPRNTPLRIVFGRAPRGGPAAAGALLARLLGTGVLVAEGQPMPAAGGVLHVPAASGRGWLLCAPGMRPVLHSRRFPAPPWEVDVPEQPLRPTPGTVLEPLAAGMWLRPDPSTPGDEASAADHRLWLESQLLGPGPHCALVVGGPGGHVTAADVAAVLGNLPRRLVGAVRLVALPVGPEAAAGPSPASTPPALNRTELPDQVAELLGIPVHSFCGLPAVPTSGPGRTVLQTFALLPGGAVGRPLGALEAAHLPPGHPAGPGPLVIRHAWPVQELQAEGTAVYRFSTDAVVEVVRAGLWLRAPGIPEPTTAARFRSLPPDPWGELVLWEADHFYAARLEYLAGEALRRLDPRSERALRPHALDVSRGTVGRTEAAPPTVAPPSSADTVSVPVPPPDTAVGPAVPRNVPRPEDRRPPVVALAPPESDPPVEGMELVVAGDLATAHRHDAPLAERPAPSRAVPSVGSTPRHSVAAYAGPLDSGSPADRSPRPAPEVEPQPVPVVLPTPGAQAPEALAAARDALRSRDAEGFTAAADRVALLLVDRPGLIRGRAPSEAVTDLAALWLFLHRPGSAADAEAALFRGGPAVMLALARCAVEALALLPAYQGPVHLPNRLNPHQVWWYAEQPTVADWALWTARKGRGTHTVPGVLAHSSGGRDAALLTGPDGVPFVVFAPGSRFSVLGSHPDTNGRSTLLMREVPRGTDSPNPAADRVVHTKLSSLLTTPAPAAPADPSHGTDTPYRHRLPGLLGVV